MSHPWTIRSMSGDFTDAGQFPGPGTHQGMGLWTKHAAIGEGATVLTAKPGAFSIGAAWVQEIGGVDMGTARFVEGTGTVNPALGSFEIVPPSAGVPSVFIAMISLQKVSYGQYTKIAAATGTQLLSANTANDPGTGNQIGDLCLDADGYPPWNWIAYRTGSGVLTLSGDISCTGADPNYNLMGFAYAGALIETRGTFELLQPLTFGGTILAGASFDVTLPDPPTP